jgi:hypothetical protein
VAYFRGIAADVIVNVAYFLAIVAGFPAIAAGFACHGQTRRPANGMLWLTRQNHRREEGAVKKINIRPTGPVRLTGTAVALYTGNCGIGIGITIP